ncbi:MAG: metal ABC transporter permease [Planctomycetes bacterium]|nr:metal ABC transporter permease [Planctomycetota bacterium]
MQFIHWLRDYEFVRHAVVTGIAVATVCSLLSVVVVLKRMAFIGQGISHAGFGGVGTAIFLGLTGVSQSIAVLFFCLATAFIIGVIARRRRVEPDSAIGILLVAAMAWGVFMGNLRGVVLDRWPAYANYIGTHTTPPSYDQLLFGSLLAVETTDMWLAIILGAAILIVCVLLFKEIIFFAFDESVGRVFGVPTTVIHYTLLTLLSVTIVIGIKLAGFVLVSALLVLPGATALLLSRRLGVVFFLSWVIGVAGTAGGLMLCLQVPQLSSGPCIVGVLSIIFGLVFGGTALRQRWAGAHG